MLSSENQSSNECWRRLAAALVLAMFEIIGELCYGSTGGL